MSRKVFYHVLVQDLEPGDVAIVRPNASSIFSQTQNKLVRVDSAYMAQGEWEVCGFDLTEERTVLVRYQNNELVAVSQ
jgi:hypothetical protein